MTIKRVLAKKVRIYDLSSGKFFYGSKEELKPSYVITPYGEKVSRVNLLGTVIEKFTSEDGNYSSITLDDGTDAIRIKSFGEPSFEKIELGDFVKVVGKLKEYNGELYVNLEVVAKENDINYEILSKLEILNSLIKQKQIVNEIKILSEQMEEIELKDYVKETYSIDEETISVILDVKKKEFDYKPMVLEIINKLDDGKGVEISKILEVLDLPDNIKERTIDELINSGSLYEPTPGKLRTI